MKWDNPGPKLNLRFLAVGLPPKIFISNLCPYQTFLQDDSLHVKQSSSACLGMMINNTIAAVSKRGKKFDLQKFLVPRACKNPLHASEHSTIVALARSSYVFEKCYVICGVV